MSIFKDISNALFTDQTTEVVTEEILNTNDENKKIDSLKIPEKLKQQLKDSKSFNFFVVKKELEYLPKLINLDSEALIYICSGLLNHHTWLIVCTSQKVIFLNKNMVYGMQQEVIPLSEINAVTFTHKLALGTISITTGADTTTIETISEKAAFTMVKKIQEAKNALSKPLSADSLNTDLDDLRKLKSLLDDEIITQEEFDAKKKQILEL